MTRGGPLILSVAKNPIRQAEILKLKIKNEKLKIVVGENLE